jgi:hypothetical protein
LRVEDPAFVFKSLPVSGDRESLAGESGGNYVDRDAVWDAFLVDVTFVQIVRSVEILAICLTGELVYFVSPCYGCSGLFEAQTNPAYSGEQARHVVPIGHRVVMVSPSLYFFYRIRRQSDL